MSDLLTDPPEFGQDKTILAIKIAAALQRMAGTVNLEDILSDPPEVGHSETTLMLKATAALQLIAENTGVLGSGEPLNVRNVGAVGDGVTDDTVALQAALAAGSIYIPYTGSRYLISSALQCPSSRRIICEPGVEIFHSAKSLAKGEATFLVGSDLVGGNENIEVIGGLWNGNADNLVRNDDETTGRFSGAGFLFKNSERIYFRHMVVKDVLCFAFWCINSDYLGFENITMQRTSAAIRGDGVHINGPSRFGFIRGLRGPTTDDLFMLGPDDGDFKVECLPTAGTAGQSSFVHPVTAGVGGDVEDWVIEDIDGGSNRAATLYRVVTAVSALRRVTIRDVRCAITSVAAPIMIGNQYAPAGLGDGLIANILLENHVISCLASANLLTLDAVQGRVILRDMDLTLVGNGTGAAITGTAGPSRATTILENITFRGTNTTSGATAVFFDSFGGSGMFIARGLEDLRTGGSGSRLLYLYGDQEDVVVEECKKTNTGWLLFAENAVNGSERFSVTNCIGDGIESLVKFTNSNPTINLTGNHQMDCSGGLIHAVNCTVIGTLIGNNVRDNSGFIIVSGGAKAGRYVCSGNRLTTIANGGGYWNIDASVGALSISGTDFPVTKADLTPLVGDIVRETAHAFIYLGASWVQIDN